MVEIQMTSDYLNELANHFILISALLAGFSIAYIANIVVSKNNNRISNALLIIATIAACCFLISVFGLTKLLQMTTEGYPYEIEQKDFELPRKISAAAFMIGIIALSALISLSGWMKSKTIGIVTTIIGILTLIIVLMVS